MLLDAFAMELSKPGRLDEASEQHIQNTLYGLGNLVYRNAQLLDAFCEETSKPERLARMTEQDLSLKVRWITLQTLQLP